MAIIGQAGPVVVYGQNPAQAGSGYQPDYNGDIGPSAFNAGIMLLDPRYGYRAPLQAGSLAAVGFVAAASYLMVDAAPSTIAVANIAAAANVVSGVPMTLVAASGAGITLSTGLTTVQPSGVVLPVGTRFIDSAPALISFGSGSIACVDPRTMISRAVSVTGSASATGGNITVRGYDFFGYPLTETIAAPASATTVNGKKGFKSITSVTPAFTDAHNYSIGTTDIYEFPFLVNTFSQAGITWNNGVITANTGFLAADTATATATTGSVRGTYATQSASDGTKRLQIAIDLAPYNIAATNGASSLFGQLQFSG